MKLDKCCPMCHKEDENYVTQICVFRICTACGNMNISPSEHYEPGIDENEKSTINQIQIMKLKKYWGALRVTEINSIHNIMSELFYYLDGYTSPEGLYKQLESLNRIQDSIRDSIKNVFKNLKK